MSAVLSNQRSSIRSSAGRSNTSPHLSPYTSSTMALPPDGLVGCNPQSRAGLDKGFEAPADQVRPALGKSLDDLRLDGADGAKGKLHVRAAFAVAQLKCGDAQRKAQVKRPGQLQVAVVGPARHGGKDHPTVLPGLYDKATEARLEAEAFRVKAQIGMSPPTARIGGESGEDGAPRSGDRDIQRHVHGWTVRVHGLGAGFDLAAETHEPGSPAFVHELERHRVQVVPSLPAAFSARDQPRGRQHLQVAHDRNPRDVEMR